MKAFLIVGFLLLTMLGTVYAYDQDIIINVGSTAVGFPSVLLGYTYVSVHCTNGMFPVNFAYNSVPTKAKGHLINAHEKICFNSIKQLATLKFISTGTAPSSLFCSTVQIQMIKP